MTSMGCLSCSYSYGGGFHAKLGGSARAHLVDDREPGEHRFERMAVAHVNLTAAARDTRVFWKRRLEHDRSEVDTGEIARVQCGSELLPFDPRRTDQLEGPRRAAPFGCVRALDVDRAGKNDCALERGMFGDGSPTEDRSHRHTSCATSLAFDDFEIRADAEFFVEQARELAHRQPVPGGMGNRPTKDSLPVRA